jgi:hypothetical protein
VNHKNKLFIADTFLQFNQVVISILFELQLKQFLSKLNDFEKWVMTRSVLLVVGLGSRQEIVHSRPAAHPLHHREQLPERLLPCPLDPTGP